MAWNLTSAQKPYFCEPSELSSSILQIYFILNVFINCSFFVEKNPGETVPVFGAARCA